MNLEDVKKFFEEQQDNDEVKQYLQGLQPVTLDGVKQFVETDEDAKKWMQSQKDRFFSTSLNSWMESTFPQKLEEEIKKRYPDETPEQKRIRELELKNEEFERNARIEKMKSIALKTASDKKIPADLIDLLVSDNEEVTLGNLTKFEESMKPYIQEQVEDRLKNSSYTPPASVNNNKAGSSSDFMAAIYENQSRL
ncbi:MULTISPECIES: DUF4355 domain-containing protein [Bacillus]|uniref:DUF4355 domain-containing protein n=1 Tax=Bacillus TaxID=1386 RepID=UPI0006AE7F23|nr:MULTISPECIES: DUF4355 domain-containing protein [Bacillus]ARJ76165.1 hypothetical protein B7941_17235 [Bacillus velezensis]AWD88875.1 DUF4355 domain-containing protein [Bacillus velezensis]AXT11984.1 DUF4355 domain-containing protein [Bacillus velezensis]KAF6691113.1 DUF4355 domain-containing protein [Bacillus sp. EKM601B]MBA9148568.1 DUF4355 domain-containing protein [Bacillus sp. EKM213B]